MLRDSNFDHFLSQLFSVMDGSLPKSLKHIISNAEYYGPSLFLLGKYESFLSFETSLMSYSFSSLKYSPSISLFL